MKYCSAVMLASIGMLSLSALAQPAQQGQRSNPVPSVNNHMQSGPFALMIKKWHHQRISWMKPILVKSNKPTVTVTLPANPTTGYRWYLYRYNSDLIEPESAKYLPPTKQLAGASGKMQFSFELDDDAFKVPSIIRVSLVYMRPWEASRDYQVKVLTFVTDVDGVPSKQANTSN